MSARPVRLVILLCFAALTVSAQQSETVLFRDVAVFDGTHLQQHRSVLVEGGKIVAIRGPRLQAPPNARFIDGSGRTLLPGLIDAHVHVGDDIDGALHQAAAFGVTTVLDMFTTPERLQRLRALEAQDPPQLADVRTAGIGATVPGGHPTEMGGPAMPTISRPEDAQGFVDARIAEGSQFIKLIYDDRSSFGTPRALLPMMDMPTLKGLVRAAHRRHKLAVVHVLSEWQAIAVLSSGVDGLAHLFIGAKVSPNFGKMVKEHHVFVIPTLTVLYWICGEGNGSQLASDSRLQPYIRPEWQSMLRINNTWLTPLPSCAGTRMAMRQLEKEGVPILAGTDAPVLGQTYGASLHGEMELLVAVGLAPTDALRAATSLPAEKFHLSDRGSIKPGFRADLVLVDGDPTRDITATRNIVAVWKRGVQVDRRPLDSPHPKP